jgi:hypothetical protein
MKALVAYESIFGNTGAIARAVAEGLEAGFDVTVADVRTLPPIGDIDLLVIGAPTHAFSTSRPRTRAHATRKATIKARAFGFGVREYLDYAPWLPGVHAAAFDTKMKTAALPGSAAHKAYRRLRGLGCHMVASAESFQVTAMTGPLAGGEEDRARRWAGTLAASIVPGSVSAACDTAHRIPPPQ